MKARATAMTRMPSTMGLSARLAGARARARGVALRPLLEKAGLTAAGVRGCARAIADW